MHQRPVPHTHLASVQTQPALLNKNMGSRKKAKGKYAYGPTGPIGLNGCSNAMVD